MKGNVDYRIHHMYWVKTCLKADQLLFWSVQLSTQPDGRLVWRSMEKFKCFKYLKCLQHSLVCWFIFKIFQLFFPSCDGEIQVSICERKIGMSFNIYHLITPLSVRLGAGWFLQEPFLPWDHRWGARTAQNQRRWGPFTCKCHRLAGQWS